MLDLFAQAPVAVPEAPRALLAIRRIYHEPEVPEHPRGAEILARFAGAERVVVPSYREIPELYGNAGEARRWLGNKREVLVLARKRTLAIRPNGRSADFIAPSHANGCALACVYCYVPRRKGFANPITCFVDVERIVGALRRHARRLGPKPQPDQIDPRAWVYDVGENDDCSVDAYVSANVRDLIAAFRTMANAKASFATKHVNPALLDYDPQGRTRIRFSLMPQRISRVLDVRAARVAERIGALDDFVAAGYEVHVNLSPVVVYDGWLADYDALLREIADRTTARTRAQLACEIIFLTHNASLHAVNLAWHPSAERLVWTPEVQEEKISETGGVNVRYRRGWKGERVAELRALVARRLPEMRVRYAF